MNLWKKYLEEPTEFFDRYKVKMRLKDVVGGKPATKEMIEAWLKAKNKTASEERNRELAEAHADTLPELIDGQAELSGTVFARVDGQLCLEGRQVKAMLKEAGNIVKDVVPTGRKKDGKPETGIAALKSKVAERVFVEEDYIPLGRTAPDAIEEKPIHVQTAMGPRDAIKRVEIVRDAEIEFTVLRKRGAGKQDVPEVAFFSILQYAQRNGLGADRSQGFGTFEVLSVESI